LKTLLRNIGTEILELLGAKPATIVLLLNDSDDDVVKFAVDMLANGRKAVSFSRA
jgi:hypothetical protein